MSSDYHVPYIFSISEYWYWKPRFKHINYTFELPNYRLSSQWSATEDRLWLVTKKLLANERVVSVTSAPHSSHPFIKHQDVDGTNPHLKASLTSGWHHSLFGPSFRLNSLDSNPTITVSYIGLAEVNISLYFLAAFKQNKAWTSLSDHFSLF